MSCKFGPRQIWDLKPIVFVVCRYMILNKFTYVCPSSISWIGTAPTLPRTAGPHGQPPTSCKKRMAQHTSNLSDLHSFVTNLGPTFLLIGIKRTVKGKSLQFLKILFFIEQFLLVPIDIPLKRQGDLPPGIIGSVLVQKWSYHTHNHISCREQVSGGGRPLSCPGWE